MIPSLRSGWLFLQRSGLSASERATVVAASSFAIDETPGAGGDKDQRRLAGLALDKIEQALRTQWQDEELLARDNKGDGQKNGKKGEKGYAADEFNSSGDEGPPPLK